MCVRFLACEQRMHDGFGYGHAQCSGGGFLYPGRLHCWRMKGRPGTTLVRLSATIKLAERR